MAGSGLLVAEAQGTGGIALHCLLVGTFQTVHRGQVSPTKACVICYSCVFSKLVTHMQRETPGDGIAGT